MLEFYYGFLDYYYNRRDFELLQMDTDSNYIAWSAENIDHLVKPELREEYRNGGKANSYLLLSITIELQDCLSKSFRELE